MLEAGLGEVVEALARWRDLRCRVTRHLGLQRRWGKGAGLGGLRRGQRAGRRRRHETALALGVLRGHGAGAGNVLRQLLGELLLLRLAVDCWGLHAAEETRGCAGRLGDLRGCRGRGGSRSWRQVQGWWWDRRLGFLWS